MDSQGESGSSLEVRRCTLCVHSKILYGHCQVCLLTNMVQGIRKSERNPVVDTESLRRANIQQIRCSGLQRIG